MRMRKATALAYRLVGYANKLIFTSVFLVFLSSCECRYTYSCHASHADFCISICKQIRNESPSPHTNCSIAFPEGHCSLHQNSAVLLCSHSGQHSNIFIVMLLPWEGRAGELSYLAPLGSENISAPYFKQCFFRGGGLPPRQSNTTPPSPKTEITNILFYILNFASIITFKM